MKIWFDTEFIEDGKTIELISIGMVAEDGREYYAEVAECDHSRACDWVRENVLAHLTGETRTRAQIAQDIVAFVGEKPEIWAYYADYDWVALCQLFGRMIDLPKGWPMYCRDLKQVADEMGRKLPKQEGTEHHALADARWTKLAWDSLKAPVAV
ncbi:MAG TPA: 3'-5' exoribonuclease [Azospirillum sp.]|nr:3'-5' exoribonuclease [Azospirillum sp.]